MAWNAALASQYGYGRVFREYPQEVLEQQPAKTLRIFQPPPALVDNLRQQQMKWWPHAMDLPEAFAVLIQQPPRRLLPIFQPLAIPYPRAWRVYLDNWAAVGRKDDVLYIARNWLMPATQPPPIAFPFLGGWQVGIMNPSDPSAIWAAQRTWIQYKPLITLLSQIGLTAWTIEVRNQAAIIRPPIDQTAIWAQYRPFLILPPPPIPLGGQPAWAWQLDNQAAVSRMDDVVYWARFGRIQVGEPGIGPPTYGYATDRYLKSWASVGRLDNVVYWARNKYGPINNNIQFIQAWNYERLNIASLFGSSPIAIQLTRAQSPLVDSVSFIPAWKFELSNLASIQYKQQIIYLIRVGLIVLSPFVPPPTQSLFKSTYLNWRHYYLDWPQVEVSFRLPAIEIITPTPQPPPVPGEISCYTIEAPPVGVAFLLAESPYVNVFMTETGLLITLTGESPHICIG